MSRCLRHEQCPQCAERGQDISCDNLGIYEDGHSYCFSCGYYEPNKKLVIPEFHSLEEKNSDNNTPPSDTSVYIPPKALTFLKKYGISDEEIKANSIGYSPSRHLLVFPLQEAWVGRYFGDNPEYPKYVTYGIKRNLMHILPVVSRGLTERVVLVEDLLSAIKVGRQCPSMPLFGSDITKTQLFRLSRYYENIFIWLDPDKHQHSIKLGQRAELFFKTVTIVFSEKDPKDYSNEEIKKLLDKV